MEWGMAVKQKNRSKFQRMPVRFPVTVLLQTDAGQDKNKQQLLPVNAGW
jgi:hypothetical protein